MDSEPTFTEQVGRILRESREAKVYEDDTKIRLAVAMAVRLHTLNVSDNRANVGRTLGPAYARDHRNNRFGRPSLLKNRSSRSTWR